MDHRGGTPHLRYVFDIGDTSEGRNPPRRPEIWKMTEEHEVPVMNMLREIYGEREGENVKGKLSGLLLNLTAEYNGADANHSRLVAATALYTIFSRCGINPGDMSASFADIIHYDTVEAVTELGSAASEISEQILRQIEQTVKDYEKEKRLIEERGSKNVLERDGAGYG